MNNHLASLAPLGLLFLGGCVAVEGLWLLTLTPRAPVDPMFSCEHSFLDARCIDPTLDTGWGYAGGDGWERESVDEAPEIVVVAQFFELGDGERALMLGGRVLEGGTIDGSLVLEHQREETDSFTESHDAGFTWADEDQEMEHHRIGLNRSGRGRMEGKLTSRISTSRAWSESDEWPASDVGRYWSDLPTWSYLRTDAGYYGAPQNAYDQDDCEGKLCTLTVVTEYEVVWDVEARRLKTDDPDDLVVDDSDPFVLPRTYYYDPYYWY